MKKIIFLLFLFSCSGSIEHGSGRVQVEKVLMKSFFEAQKRTVEAKAKYQDKEITLNIIQGKNQRVFLAKLLYSQNKKKQVQVKYRKEDSIYFVEDVRLLP